SSRTTFKRDDGTLHFTNKRLAWCKDGEQTPAVEVLLENYRDQQVSKPDKPKVMLKVSAAAPGAPAAAPVLSYIFVWTQEDKAAALAERWKFVGELSPLSLRRAKAGAAASPAAASAAATTAAAGGNAGGSAGGGGTPAPAAPSDNPEYSKVRIGDVPASVDEVKLRQDVLSKNADLARVHRSLVLAGLVSEDEFWSTRKHILETFAVQSQLCKGESSAWLDLAPSTQETGNFKFIITPNVARRIFKEYPQVKHAYIDNVPHKVGEKTFWKRFVASQFFNRGKSGDSYKGRDNIFDKCLAEEDAAFDTARELNHARLTRLLDLTRTEEDSTETGNAPDFTMRPSPVDKKQPLIRRFNHRSQLVLQPVIGASSSRRQPPAPVPSSQPAAAAVDKALVDATVLRDLETAPAQKRVRLDIRDRTRYLANLTGESAPDPAPPAAARPADPAALRIGFDISRPLGGCGDTQKTMAAMAAAAHRLTAQKRPNRIQELQIPEDVSTAIAECHGAGTEMLRHLWALLRLPPTPERQQKAEKIVAAFEGVGRHIRETVARANAAESKNPKLGAMVEKMLQPIAESLRTGRQAFAAQAAPRAVPSA
ncbi:RNA polymerase II transcription factor B subunit 1, partial [Coemansia javaensis]